MAELLDVWLDYLVGKTDLLLDSKITKRIMEIQKLSADEQKTVFSFSMLSCGILKHARLALLLHYFKTRHTSTVSQRR